MIIKWITSSMYLSQYKFNKFAFIFFVHFTAVALIFCGAFVVIVLTHGATSLAQRQGAGRRREASQQIVLLCHQILVS